MRLASAFAAAVLVALASAAPSWADSVYYAGPGGGMTSGCTAAAAPCRLDYAISLATTGDTVVVEPGTYLVTSPLAASGGVLITAQAGRARPTLIGASSLTSDTLTLSGGASARRLYVESNESDGRGGAALSIDGGRAANMLLYASASDPAGMALRELDSAAGTTVVNTVARSAAPGGEAVFFTDGASPGTARAVNVTAVGEAAGVVGFKASTSVGSAAIKNSIAHGGPGAMDLVARPPTNSIFVSFSNFHAARPSDYWDRGGNQSASPRFEDAAAHNYREATGSPTIAAGQTDQTNQDETDPDGNPRVTGPQTDIGAYQYPTRNPETNPNALGDSQFGGSGPNLSPPASGSAGAPEQPRLGLTVLVAPLQGTVLVRRAGSRAFVTLAGLSSVPVGSVLDTRRGSVELTTSVGANGKQQTATFHGGLFRVRQPASARGRTDIVLLGGNFAACRRRPGSHLATASRSRRPRVVRQLWGHDQGGSYQTFGRTSIATVRGTTWLTQDRCDGTLTRVLDGKVVVRDPRRHRSVVVSAGHSFLTRAA